MTAAYWIGVATPFALALIVFVAVETFRWWRWWWLPEDGSFRGGWGFVHEADFYSADYDKWYPRGRHTHWWPPSTPHWVANLCEPVRIRLCYRKGDHRPPAQEGKG